MSETDPSKQLREAINRQDFFTVKMLLDRGVDPNDANLKGNTALHRAVIVQDAALIDLVMRYGPDLTKRNHDLHTPASLADAMGDRETAQKLGFEAPSKRPSV